jgi:hypothetical protein
MRKYDQIPDPRTFSEEIVPIAYATIVTGAMAIIATNYEKIMTDPQVRDAAKDGAAKILMEINKRNSSGKISLTSSSSSSGKRDYSYSGNIEFNNFAKRIDKSTPKNYLTKLIKFYGSVDKDAAEFETQARSMGLEDEIADPGQSSPRERNNAEAPEESDADRRRRLIKDIFSEQKIMEKLYYKLKNYEKSNKMDEVSVVANIAGYSLPLGVSNQEDPDGEMEKTIENNGWSRVKMNAKNSIDNERFNKKSDDFYLRR